MNINLICYDVLCQAVLISFRFSVVLNLANQEQANCFIKQEQYSA